MLHVVAIRNPETERLSNDTHGRGPIQVERFALAIQEFAITKLREPFGNAWNYVWVSILNGFRVYEIRVVVFVKQAGNYRKAPAEQTIIVPKHDEVFAIAAFERTIPVIGDRQQFVAAHVLNPGITQFAYKSSHIFYGSIVRDDNLPVLVVLIEYRLNGILEQFETISGRKQNREFHQPVFFWNTAV